MTVNTKRMSRYLQSLAMTAVVAGLFPVLLMGGILLSLEIVQAVWWWPVPLAQQLSAQVMQVLAVLGNGNPRQGLVTVGATSSLVGLLFDTYALCSNRGLTDR